MTAYRPLVLISGVTAQLPPGNGTSSDAIVSTEGSISFEPSVVTSATSGVLLDAFPSGDFSSALYSIQASRGNNIHTTELKLIHDSLDVFSSEYGTVYSSGVLASYSGSLVAGNVVVNAFNNEAVSTKFRIIRYAQTF